MLDKYFSAANTTSGFVNYFDDAIDKSIASQILYIKGGSGVGKSTLMRKASKIAQDMGYDVTEINCSSDPKSLDGVVIRPINVALFDATMPHISDPLYPRLNGRIVDLSVYLCSKVLNSQKDVIIENVKAKKECYSMLYSLLSSVPGVIDSMASLIKVDKASIKNVRHDIVEQLAGGVRCRRGYLKAIDVGGILDNTSGILKDRTVIKIKSKCDIVALDLIDSVSRLLDDELISHEKYYSILSPNKVETIATASYIVTTSATLKGDIIYNLDDMYNIKNSHAYTILSKYIDDIITLSSAAISSARECHNNLEAAYQKAMDYESLERYTTKLLDSIFG